MTTSGDNSQNNPKPLTAREATRLAESVMRQIGIRYPAMKGEASAAFNLPVPANCERPPNWVLAAIRIVFTGKTSLKEQTIKSSQFVEALGAIVGMAQTWDAVLTSFPSDEQKLEEKFPVLGTSRTQIRKLSAPALKAVDRLSKKMSRAAMKPALRSAYIKGQREGSLQILDDEGKLATEGSIRSELCYMLWLYWPQIQFLDNLNDLAVFLRQMRQDDLTKKNLEKVSREIGLKLKGKGRPKNLQSKRPK